ncbi:MAG: hypothetical protein K6E98_12215 [Lachnospiraceae bacterium]|nr:hypothetical protein [Lachnospiraceae bacterium]
MRELLDTLVSSYNDYRGTGKLLALFLVSVLIIYLYKNKTNPLMFILSPIAGIAYAFTLLRERCIKEVKKKTLGEVFVCSRLYGNIMTVLVIGFTVLMIMLSGRWIFSDKDHYLAQNSVHIKQDYIGLSDEIHKSTGIYDGSGEEKIRILSTPEISNYLEIYDPALELLVAYPSREEMTKADDDITYIYDQMLISTPDQERVIRLTREKGYDHIVYNSQKTYWNLPLEEFGYELIGEYGDYKIYKDGTE